MLFFWILALFQTSIEPHSLQTLKKLKLTIHELLRNSQINKRSSRRVKQDFHESARDRAALHCRRDLQQKLITPKFAEPMETWANIGGRVWPAPRSSSEIRLVLPRKLPFLGTVTWAHCFVMKRWFEHQCEPWVLQGNATITLRTSGCQQL